MKLLSSIHFLRIIWVVGCLFISDSALAWQKKSTRQEDIFAVNVDSLLNRLEQMNRLDHHPEAILFHLADYYLKRATDGAKALKESADQPGLIIAQKLLNHLLTEFPAGEFADDATYTLAYIDDLQNKEVASRQYLDFLTRFPESEYVPHVYLNLGEISLTLGKPAQALQYFQNSLRQAPPNLLNQALFRVGYCQFSQKNYRSTVEYLTRFLNFNEKRGLPQNRNSEQLKKNAIELIIAGLGQSANLNALDSLLKINNYPRWGADLLWQISSQNNRAGMTKKMQITACDLYLNQYPELHQRAEVQLNRIEILIANGQFENALSSLNFIAAKQFPTSAERLEMLWHRALDALLARAQQDRNRQWYRIYINQGGNYLNYFADKQRSVLVHWNRALALDQVLGAKDAAFSAFLKITQQFPEHELSRSAAEKTITLAEWEMNCSASPLIPDDALLQRDSSALTLGDLTPAMRSGDLKFIVAAKNYARLFPENGSTADYLYAAGKLLFFHDEFTKASDVFEKYRELFPDHKKFDQATLKLMHCYFQQQEMDKALSISENFPQTENGQLPQLMNALRSEIELWKQTPLLKNPRANIIKVSRKNDLQIYKTAVVLHQQKRYELANHLFASLINDRPEFRYRADCLRRFAIGEFMRGNLTNAANTFKQLAEIDTLDVQKKDNLLRAAKIFLHQKNYAAAIDIYQQIFHTYPHSFEAEKCLYAVATLHEKMGHDELAAKAKVIFCAQYPYSNKHFQHLLTEAVRLKRSGENSAAQKVLSQLISLLEKSRMKEFEAWEEANFLLTELKYSAFFDDSLKTVGSTNHAARPIQKQHLLSLVSKYTTIRDQFGSRAQQAQFRIGKCFERYADFLLRVASDSVKGDDVNSLLETYELAENLYHRATKTYQELVRLQLPVENRQFRQDAGRSIVRCLSQAAALNRQVAEFLAATPVPISDDAVAVLAYENQVLSKIILPHIQAALRYSHQAGKAADSLAASDRLRRRSEHNHLEIHNFAFDLLHKQSSKIMALYARTWIQFFKLIKSDPLSAAAIDEDLSISLNALLAINAKPNLFTCAGDRDLIQKIFPVFECDLMKMDSISTSVSQQLFKIKKGTAVDTDLSMQVDEQLANLQEYLLNCCEAVYKLIVEQEAFKRQAQKVQYIMLKLRPEKYVSMFNLRILNTELVSDKSWHAFIGLHKGCVSDTTRKLALTARQTSAVEFWGSLVNEISPDQKITCQLDTVEITGRKTSFAASNTGGKFIIHYQRKINLAARPLRASAKLLINQGQKLFINGQLVETSGMKNSRGIVVTPELSGFFKTGENIICFHAESASAEKAWAMHLSIMQAVKWPELSQKDE